MFCGCLSARLCRYTSGAIKPVAYDACQAKRHGAVVSVYSWPVSARLVVFPSARLVIGLPAWPSGRLPAVSLVRLDVWPSACGPSARLVGLPACLSGRLPVVTPAVSPARCRRPGTPFWPSPSPSLSPSPSPGPPAGVPGARTSGVPSSTQTTAAARRGSESATSTATTTAAPLYPASRRRSYPSGRQGA